MSPANNATPTGRLRVGLVTDSERARSLAEAIRGQPEFELVGHSGLRQADALPDVPWFDDTRVFLVQARVDAVVLALGTRLSVELAEAAAERGLHVWRTPPLARSFATATELALRRRARPLVCRVASWWEHVGEHVRWGLHLQEGFKPIFSELRISAPGPAVHSWRASQVDAVGGVLADSSYPMLEALVAARGLPERVSAAIGKGRRRPGEAPRETEDFAAAMLRYVGGGLVVLRATWDIPPFQTLTLHHGAEATLAITDTSAALRDREDRTLQERTWPVAFWAEEMRQFAEAIRAGVPDPAGDAALERHIAVTAILEAAYLSARTGQPETPRKFYEVQKWPEPAL